jgi:hypothetical protein
MWEVRFHPVATKELARLPPRERAAMLNAVEKLTLFGPALPFPHCSAIQGVERLRELRPRAGRSPWRAFYRRVGGLFVVAAIGPEAGVDKRGFERAAAAAIARLAEVEEDRS